MIDFRSCGRLFCSECSEQSVPIPAEQLYTPVRVCDSCYDDLTADRQTWSEEKIREFEAARDSAEKARETAVAAREAVDKTSRQGINDKAAAGVAEDDDQMSRICDKLGNCSAEAEGECYAAAAAAGH